jgi:aspartate kinase
MERMLNISETLDVSRKLRSELVDEFTSSRDRFIHGHGHALSVAPTLALGERWSARMLAEILDYPFVDATEVIKFKRDGTYDEHATLALASSLPERAVIPGFYGSDERGRIRTFPRNGSDISGAIVARLTNASLYENWTDADGVLFADPNIVPAGEPIESLTRRELEELAYRGTSILHGDALAPLRGTSIPVQIRNTWSEHPGTRVVPHATDLMRKHRPVVGIAGRTDFTLVQLAKVGMNHDLGFLARLCNVFAQHRISIELTPSSINAQSVVVADSELDGKWGAVCESIKLACAPDSLTLERRKLALLCIVGETMAHQHGVLARAATTLGNAGINIRLVDQGASEISIIMGVEATDYKAALRALHAEFVRD